MEIKLKNRLAILALGAVLSSGLFVGAASAVTVTTLGIYTLNGVGTSPDGYYDAIVSTPKSKFLNFVSKTFHFVAAAGFPTVEIVTSPSTALYALTSATWIDTVTHSVTNVSLGSNVLTLIAGRAYDLVFKVTHNATATNTFVQSSFAVTPSPVPVPPAAILLLSGLVGIGALGRKRSGKVSV